MHVALQSTSRCFEAALALRTQGCGGTYAMDKRTKVQSEQREGKGEGGAVFVCYELRNLMVAQMPSFNFFGWELDYGL